MSIELTGAGNTVIDWSGVLSAVNSQESTTKIEGVKVDAGKDGVGLTFSVSEGGTVRMVELSMPMLDSPSEIDEGLIAGFCEKLGDGSMLNLTEAQVKAREAEQILAWHKPENQLVLLDERGLEQSSMHFAQWMQKKMIDKACEWIIEHTNIPYEGEFIFINGSPVASDYIEWCEKRLEYAKAVADAFKKAMEE